MKLQKGASSFHLNKWYLDCVTKTGQTTIGYSAELGWKPLSISYNSYLKFDGRAAPSSKTNLLRVKHPEILANGISWASDRLSCSGSWRPLLTEGLPPLTLFQDNSGSVTWHCLQPLSEVKLQFGEEKYIGLGYVERLEMSITPWRLPIKELHWGRFLTKRIYVVWIEWRGQHPFTVVYLNGRKIENAKVSESALYWDGGSLKLGEHICLRNGRLIDTALSNIPGASSLFPKSILHTHECKWRSSGKLTYRGETRGGWAIHEIVRFG